MAREKEIKTTERGWIGHFICGDRCLFRRNTLIEYKDIKIVVSTVGNMVSRDENKIEEIGSERYYETMAFYSDEKDDKYHDADIGKQITFDSNWSISEYDKDNEANEMHENVVNELKLKLLKNQICLEN